MYMRIEKKYNIPYLGELKSLIHNLNCANPENKKDCFVVIKHLCDSDYDSVVYL